MKVRPPLQQEMKICGDDRMQKAGRAVARWLLTEHEHQTTGFTLTVITLCGDLGAGKTTLVKGIVNGLLNSPVVTPGHRTFDPVVVNSPTFTLVEQYEYARGTIYHLDLYRLETPEDLEPIGLRDMLLPGNVIIIEWPEKAATRLPPVDIDLRIRFAVEADGTPDHTAGCRIISGGAALIRQLATQG